MVKLMAVVSVVVGVANSGGSDLMVKWYVLVWFCFLRKGMVVEVVVVVEVKRVVVAVVVVVRGYGWRCSL